jgi:hypothetical protein
VNIYVTYAMLNNIFVHLNRISVTPDRVTN